VNVGEIPSENGFFPNSCVASKDMHVAGCLVLLRRIAAGAAVYHRTVLRFFKSGELPGRMGRMERAARFETLRKGPFWGNIALAAWPYRAQRFPVP
jgi:hypothetical protein